MTTTELLTAIRDALAADTTISEWCTSEFSKSPTIFLGLDQQNPPPEGDYPLIAILGVEQVRGDTNRDLEWNISLGVGVINSEIVTSGVKKTATGFLQCETLRELVENAVYRARIVPMESAGEASTVSYHPIYIGFSRITASKPKSTRRGLPG